MITKRLVFILALLALATSASQARADMTINGYAPENHYRFHDEADPAKAFIGEAYDWSGVGRSSGGQWATMISPQYFLTATHYQPANGATVTFYADNTLGSVQLPYTVDSWSQVIEGDLCLRRLTQPISDNIAYYPILDPCYVGQVFFAYGRLHRVGRNKIDGIIDTTVSSIETRSMFYDYDTSNGLGADECRVEPGDSGGPSFAVSGGELALIGIHWFQYTTASGGLGSGDSFVPHYIDEIYAAIPEPTSAVLLLIGSLSVAVLHYSRRRG